MDNRNIKRSNIRNINIKTKKSCNVAILPTIFLLSTIFLITIPNVFAFGIGSPYWKNNPLEISPGETKEISFNLQNCPSLSETCDQKDITIQAVLEEGEEIAEITSGSQYAIPFGTADTNIILRISIPENADIDSTYNIRFSVSSAPEEEQGNIQLGVKYNVEFPVVVSSTSSQIPSAQDQDTSIPEEQKERKINATLIGIIIAILMVVIFIFIVLKLKKRQPMKQAIGQNK